MVYKSLNLDAYQQRVCGKELQEFALRVWNDCEPLKLSSSLKVIGGVKKGNAKVQSLHCRFRRDALLNVVVEDFGQPFR
jgi:hypothetical protein